MNTLWITAPLAVLAIVIAVVPVLVGTIRHERSVKEGEPATTRLAAREAESVAQTPRPADPTCARPT